jgi:hypothetical protein
MKNLEFENFQMEENSDSQISDEQKYISYSLKIMSCLGAKMREYNKENENSRATLEQLKTVFINAAANNLSELSTNEWSMARVNMFLSIKGGRKIAYAEKVKAKDLSDASLLIVPEEEDFIQAKEDLKAYELDFEVGIDNLYLERKSETMQLNWE